ncbi:MAG: hypothetical protein KJP17_04630 [Gammaproteobacteria bacterium]|nr:hypothetical protein [Gammaproteobacteria bacterium]
MPDSKHLKWDDSFGKDAGQNPEKDETPVASNEPAANDADGWQQYRRWISKAPTTRNRRTGIDPSLYSWKGYREWSDKVRRDWARESSDDKD